MNSKKTVKRSKRPKNLEAKTYIKAMCWGSAIVIGSVAAAFIPDKELSAYGVLCENHKEQLKPILKLLKAQPKDSVIAWIGPKKKISGFIPGLVMSDGTAILTGGCENKTPLLWETKDSRFVKSFAAGIHKNFEKK